MIHVVMDYSSGDFECPVCHDTTDDERIVNIVRLTCGHKFHKDCLMYMLKGFVCPLPNCGKSFFNDACNILGTELYECILSIAASSNSKNTEKRLSPYQEVAISLKIMYDMGIPTRFFPVKVDIGKCTIHPYPGYYTEIVIESVVNTIIYELFYGGFYFGSQPKESIGRSWMGECTQEDEDALTEFLNNSRIKLRGTVVSS